MRGDYEQRLKEKFDQGKARWESRGRRYESRGHIWTGLFLVLIGAVAMLKSFKVPLPEWLFSWQMLLIAIGLFTGIRHRFRNPSWFMLILVGGAFLVNDYFYNGELREHIWPLILIVMGIFFIFRTSRTGWSKHSKKNGWSEVEGTSPYTQESNSKDDFLDTTSIFGSTKKNILSKDFKGGDIVNIFGGTELNFTQADINGSVLLDITTVFGGSKLVVPSNWTIKSELVTIFGGIEDKRAVIESGMPDKVVVLKGTVIFGGIEIKSF